MNRRDFFKKIGAVCAAVVAVPIVVKAAKKKPLTINGVPIACRELLDCNAPVKWQNYYTEHTLNEGDLEKFRKAFKNTKFIAPLKSCVVSEKDAERLIRDFKKSHYWLGFD